MSPDPIYRAEISTRHTGIHGPVLYLRTSLRLDSHTTICCYRCCRRRRLLSVCLSVCLLFCFSLSPPPLFLLFHSLILLLRSFSILDFQISLSLSLSLPLSLSPPLFLPLSTPPFSSLFLSLILLLLSFSVLDLFYI